MKKKIYVVSLIFFLMDLISKIVILNINGDYTIIKNFFYIDRMTNAGAAFSIFSGGTIIFIIIAVLVLIYVHKHVISDLKTKFGFIGTSMLIGGIVGNLFDRVVYGEVVDFLLFKFGHLYFPVFNLADVFICVGILFIAIDYIKANRK